MQLISGAEETCCQPLLAELESLRRLFMAYASLDDDCILSTKDTSTFNWVWEAATQDKFGSAMLCIAALYGATEFVKTVVGKQGPQCSRGILLASSTTELRYSDEAPTENHLGLTRFLLEQKALPNLELPDICRLRSPRFDRDSSSAEPYFSSPPWTTWNLFLFRLSQRMFLGMENGSVAWRRRLELFLEHGADPSVCFIGYQLPQPENNAAERIYNAKEIKPFHVDLPTMLKVWGIEVSDALQNFLSDSFRSKFQRLGEWLSGGLQWKQGATNGLRQLDPEGLRRQEFLVLKVTSLQKVKDIRIIDLENGLDAVSKRCGISEYMLTMLSLTIMF